MAAEWRNNGEAVDGLFIVDVDPEDGGHVQTFRGATVKDVTDQLLKAQFNASRFINQLKLERTPDPQRKVTTFKPRELTADERFQAVRDLQDPNKFTDAIDRVITSRLGAPISVVAQKLQTAEEDEAARLAVEATMEFISMTPEWYPTDKNKETLATYMRDNKIEWTAKNFSIAFDTLMGDGLLTKRPEPTTTEVPDQNASTERIVPPQQTTRPRGSFSTGVRPSEFSNTPPPKPKQKYTRQDIDNMPKSIYAQKMLSEAGFAAAVNALG